MVSLWLPLSALAATALAATYPSFTIPAFDLAEPDGLLPALAANGIANIKNIPRFAETRAAYMKAATICVATHGAFPGLQQRTLADATRRLTLSSRSSLGLSDTIVSQCPDLITAHDAYTSLLDTVTASLATLLHVPNATSLADIVANGAHLDHFHGYTRLDATNASRDDLTLQMHTDNGLFLLTSAPLFFTDRGDAVMSPDPIAGLIIELNATRVHPTLKEDELTIMVGDGVTQWGSFGHTFPSVLHGMVMPAAPGVFRAFSGRMLLLPASHVMTNTGLSFQQYNDRVARHLVDRDAMPIGCPVGRKLVAMDAACTYGVWKATPGSPPRVTDANCTQWCNNGDYASDCAKNKCMRSATAQGVNCWMVCSKVLTTCATSSQICAGQTLRCK
ncbi:hypothetical protein SDRG_00906 [Saprolegnia diclina VS20]|uniref:Metallo-beta-lactamase domain-containing protein n=1 Tax=Saprolegnia diclina (strain VS20) TaxID=1156394 RepID=T0S9U8_SAPDV|nr:hypothetical protein SDRG_00906 [Saprolegnia diclina VS20]EQC42063.1 hypothetical protein SDRG_00906 [Saprolegnia diclina VS20]|eukprot:XP_008604632.1 hypothetical protein SDRG_00906 [Saprolegnia diclina VS20]